MKDTIKYVFVDCFDTIIGRDCNPEEIKLFWANEFSKEIGFKISGTQIYNIRRDVEEKLYIKSLKNGFSGEFNVKDVYDSIIERMKVGKIIAQEKDFDLEYLQNLEIEVELRHQFKIAKTIKLLESLRNKGKKIYLLSDFYMDKQCFKRFFEHHKINDLFDNLFVSCDYKLNKSKGAVYAKVIAEVGASGNECLMIGDNKTSDIKNAKVYGFKTKHIKAHYVQRKELSLKGTYKRYFKNEFKNFDKYNLENYAFQLYATIQELAMRCKKQAVKQIFFLSREGRFLKILFDKYCELNNYDFQTKYLYVSRNSTFIASLKDLKDEKFERLFKQYSDISIMDFVKSLSFEDFEIELLKSKLVQLDFNLEIKAFALSQEFKLLTNSQEFKEIYDNKRREQKEIFRKYLLQEGFVFGEEALTIVDVGWKGSMQDSIVHILDGQVVVNGFYLGFDELGVYNERSFKEGLLFDIVHEGKTYYNDLLSYRRDHYECILRANHSRAERYKVENGVVVPILENAPDKELYDNILKDYQDAVVNKFCRIAETCRDNVSHDDLIKLQPYLRMLMLLKMTKADYNWLNKNYSTFKDGFGKITMSVEHSETLKHFYADKLRALKRLILNRKNLWR